MPNWTEMLLSALSLVVSAVVIPIVKLLLRTYSDRIEKLEARGEEMNSKVATLTAAQSVAEANYQNILREMQDVRRMIERLFDRLDAAK